MTYPRWRFLPSLPTHFAILSTFAASNIAQAASDTKTFDVVAIERPRIMEKASKYLREEPVTVTASHCERSAGGKHDFFSEGDYWWPDPKDPNGPYIQRDGMSNPENFTGHRHALIRLGVQVPTLTAAWVYAQAIHGRTTGRGTGIIDTIHLVEVVRSIPFLAESKSLSSADYNGVKKWF